MADHEVQMDEGDDIYEPEEPKQETQAPKESNSKADELEEGEEEDESGAMDEDDDDSDIDIITERKDGTKAAPPPQSKYSEIRNIPQRSASTDTPVKPTPTKKDDSSRSSQSAHNVAMPSADRASAAASKSTVDINANPVYPAAGKPITQVNIDEDLPDNEKPWRKPGTDISDYFNYGFDEFTWALYAAKQESIRGEFGADAFAVNNKKMMEDFNNMMMMGGMGMGGGAGGNSGGMTGMDGMPAEMQAMMQQMMASGMDPSQMDPSQMGTMFAGMQNGMGGASAQGNQGQNFGGVYAGNQGGYGFDQGMAAGGGSGGGGGGRGGFGGGGGRGRRGRW
ncbi:Pre-mRNA polyadenylation factor FIP1 [Hirsutella minnesotensis 3608]|nr:Pre-mRNA polyadenylation factor FIP1 [Hirsutella minnesotensis 3608]